MMIRIVPLARKLIVAALCAAVTVFALVGGSGKAATHGFSAAISDDGHDHHGHSHDDEDEPSALPGHDHDRIHIGDHSHDTPAAAVLTGFRFAGPGHHGQETPDERIASRPTPPGDRPPREA